MSADITRQVIEALRALPELSLFIDTHFRVESVRSHRPIFTREGMYFPTKHYIVRRKLSPLQKLAYYLKDWSLYLKIRRSF